MAITVPTDGAIISASTFGKPVADQLNVDGPAIATLQTERKAFGLLTTWTGSATSGVAIPFSTVVYQRGGWVPSNSINPPVGSDGIYAWSLFIQLTTAQAGLSYMVLTAGGNNYSDGFAPNAAALTASGITKMAPGQLIALSANFGPVQTVRFDLSFIRIGTL
jgi:hypothetical protein